MSDSWQPVTGCMAPARLESPCTQDSANRFNY